AALAYRNARRLPLTEGLRWVEQAESSLRSSRHAYELLGQKFAQLWPRENKPYAEDWTLRRFQEMVQKYDQEIAHLAEIRASAKPDRSLPTPRGANLEIVEEVR